VLRSPELAREKMDKLNKNTKFMWIAVMNFRVPWKYGLFHDQMSNSQLYKV
jgi:hypothetical protein